MYTADQVAEILHLHPKTVRKFIRQGKLKARKVGKQWRVTESNLKHFIGDEILPDAEDKEKPGLEKNRENKPKVQVSSIIDIYVNNIEEATRIANSIFALLNCKDPGYGNVRCDHLYREDEKKARFILWGTPRFMRDLLACISKITE